MTQMQFQWYPLEKSDTDMLCAYYFLYNTLKNTEHAPKLKIIDNEAPAALK